MVKNVRSIYKFHTHVVQVYFQPFWCNSFLKCALQPKIAKKTLKPSFWKDSKSFMVIDVTPFKSLSLPVMMSCHEQHVMYVMNVWKLWNIFY